ncbi:MAG: NYN domain-containing protein [Nitrospira sp.]|nr:NYN domain-containing protein [Nitrospira sp.]
MFVPRLVLWLLQNPVERQVCVLLLLTQAGNEHPKPFFFAFYAVMTTSYPKERAMIFIDGSNWYHAMKRIGLSSSRINYWNFARKLSQEGRSVVEIRYYVGKVSGDLIRTRKQELSLDRIKNQNVTVVLGRVEKQRVQPDKNQIRQTLKKLRGAFSDLNPMILDKLESLMSEGTYVDKEKMVDVNLAVDMVARAMKDEFDVAYLVSADGDFVPAGKIVRETGKKVFAATPGCSRELQKAVNSFIHLPKEWFSDDLFLVD